MAANCSAGTAVRPVPMSLVMTTTGKRKEGQGARAGQGPVPAVAAARGRRRCGTCKVVLLLEKKKEALGQLVPLGSNASLRFHLRPIDVVVSLGPSSP